MKYIASGLTLIQLIMELSKGRIIFMSISVASAYCVWGLLISLQPPFYPQEAEKNIYLLKVAFLLLIGVNFCLLSLLILTFTGGFRQNKVPNV